MPLENCELHAFVPREDVASAMNRSASVIDGTEASALICGGAAAAALRGRPRTRNTSLAKPHQRGRLVAPFIAICSPRYPRAPVSFLCHLHPFPDLAYTQSPALK